MSAIKRYLLDLEANKWFNSLVKGFPVYDQENWNGHPNSYEQERNLSHSRLYQLERAFEMSYKFKPSPSNEIPPPRWTGKSWR